MKRFYFLLLAFFMLGSIANAQISILLVNDNNKNAERVDNIKASLDRLGYAYTYFDATTELASPTADFMNPFDLVLWYTGNDFSDLYFWNAEADNDAVISYLDAGGMMWVQGLDFLYDRYGSAADTFQVGDFVYDYMGIEEYHAQSHYDDGVYSDGVPFMTVTPENGIFTLDSLVWTWSTLWGADAMVPTANATSIYVMGPEAYDFGGYASCIYNENGDAKILSCAIESAKFDTEVRTDSFINQGLTYFAQFASGTSVSVESITVIGEGEANTIDVKGGTLQMIATVLPEDATNPNVLWSLENNTANATISATGLLKATGFSNGNGSVTVVATSIDGSDVSASFDVTITNQGSASDFEVLLVNDNANTSSRYKELDTVLTNLGVLHTVYNAGNLGTYPDLNYINSFDVICWYTGNDGDDIRLWDVSDSTDVKFNAPLISYLDNGGIVWLQGLDFLWDIFKTTPYPEGDGEFESGTFIRDYMGIKKYVAQSHADDGARGVVQMDVVPDNGICEITPLQFAWSTLWYSDALTIDDNAVGVYKMGPTDYQFAPFYSGVFMENGASKILTFTFETAKLDSRENAEQLYEEVLGSLELLVDVPTLEPTVLETLRSYPNPVTNEVTFEYAVKKAVDVNFFITDMTGRRVYFNSVGNQDAGTHSLTLSTKEMGLTTGNYFYSFMVDGKVASKQLIVIQ